MADHTAAGPIVKSFEVVVSQNQCDHQRMVNNRAGLLVPGYAPVISNVVSHPVECPPVGFPNHQPSYAEDEIQIHPYPLVTGTASEIRVRVSNYSATPRPSTSPSRPTQAIWASGWPTALRFPGRHNPGAWQRDRRHALYPGHIRHYCIQVVVTVPGTAYQLITQRNLDVAEDLQPGVTDNLVFPVRNPLPVSLISPWWWITPAPAGLPVSTRLC